ncbi:hypothetical protein ACFQ4C_17920 [Larkinella insperata]|uniref:Uncharacterized protein n=1 Tax=Larkinella insperata TaxID=332158 RepID=A0ABW3QK86_9BACT|nr:hypothetical protein [Larkinella insperata]
MPTAKKISHSKNALWDIYADADPVVRTRIQLDLKEVALFRHWYETASKGGYDLTKAKAPLRDIFLKHMPETAKIFGITLSPQAA